MANAGIGAYGRIMSLTDDQIREIDATNFLGTVWSVPAAVPTFLEQGGGDVVIVSSVAGLRGGPWEAVYAGPSTPRWVWPARWTASCASMGSG